MMVKFLFGEGADYATGPFVVQAGGTRQLQALFPKSEGYLSTNPLLERELLSDTIYL
jgi:hypothetical protein